MNYKFSCGLFLVGVFGLFITVFGVPSSYLFRPEEISCRDLEIAGHVTISSGQCLKPNKNSVETRLIIEAPASEAEKKLVLANFSDEPAHFEFLAKGVNGKSFFSINDPEGNVLLHSMMIGSNWSSNALFKVVVDLPAKFGEVFLIQSPGEGKFYLSNFAVTRPSKPLLHFERIKMGTLSTKYIFAVLLLLVAVGAFGIFCHLPISVASLSFLMLTGLLLLTFLVGLPYASNVGVLDAGDDTCYLDWAFALGNNLNPDLTKSTVNSFSRINNVGPWGVGLALAPGLWLVRLVYGFTPTPGGIHVLMMTIETMAYAMLSVFIFFAAFRQVFSLPIAATISFLTLAATSLIKWTYYRNIFSHSIEAFFLACMTFYFIRMFFKGDKSWRTVIIYGLLGAFLTQVRREECLFLLLPPLVFCFQPGGLKDSWRLKVSFLYGVLAVLAVALLQMTNYFTDVGQFWSASGSNSLYVKTPKLLFYQLKILLYDADNGLFPGWYMPSLAALASLYFARAYWRLTVPLLIFMGVNFCIIISIGAPDGSEWLNRYFLRFNPFVYGGAGYLLSVVGPVWRRWIAAGMFTSMIYAMVVFYHYQVPYGLPFYSDVLADAQIFYALPLKEQFLAFVSLPITILLLLTVGGFFVLQRKAVR